jgi:hypothetical protein
MAAELLAAHRTGQARVVIGRASDYYGPHGTGSTAGQTVFGRIPAGSWPETNRNGPGVSTSRTPSTTCRTSPAVAGIFSPLLRDMRETTYPFRAPFGIDAINFQAFGHLQPAPHHDAIQQTIAWYRSR